MKKIIDKDIYSNGILKLNTQKYTVQDFIRIKGGYKIIQNIIDGEIEYTIIPLGEWMISYIDSRYTEPVLKTFNKPFFVNYLK